VRFLPRKYAIAAFTFLTLTSEALARGGGTHELGFNYRYETAKSATNSYSFHELQGFYLVPFHAIWIGGELDYANNRNPSYGSSRLELGGLAKYWIVDPGGAVGFNIFAGFGFGKEDTGTDPHSTMTLKMGPELDWFIWDGAAVSTRIQYASRRAGPSYTVIGVYTGISLFF
jgi:hypothetical protein